MDLISARKRMINDGQKIPLWGYSILALQWCGSSFRGRIEKKKIKNDTNEKEFVEHLEWK